MKLLVVSPDYASHYYPLSALAREWQARGGEAVVAAGPGLAARIERDGLRRLDLPLGAGRNPGLARPEEQPGDEGANLRAFLAATEQGMTATLRYQALRRRHDLLWEPEQVAARLAELLRAEKPELVVADQLAYGATLALRALRQPYVGLLPGHPSALPEGDGLFGYPPTHPPGVRADALALATLRDLSAAVDAAFTRGWNATLLALRPDAASVASAFAARSPLLTLVAYPDELRAGRHLRGPRVEYVGPLVREEPLDARLRRRLAGGRRPTVYVALGSFLSARADVLARLVAGVRLLGARGVVAHGTAPRSALGTLPPDWVVEETLPQPAVLRHCELVLCHGGNNTGMEALEAGVPVLAAPFASDQFAGAEDVRRAGIGDAVDPNRMLPEEIAWRSRLLLEGAAAARAAELGRRLRARPGAAAACDLLEDVLGTGGAGGGTRLVAAG